MNLDSTRRQLPLAVRSHERAFALGVAVNAAFIGVQVACGLWAHSLALLSDAGHNFSDVLALLLAWWASRLASRQPTHRLTYGMRRSTIIAATTNALLLNVAVLVLVFEGVRRLLHPAPVAGMVVMWVALVGLLVNGGSALLFLRDRARDLNVRAAFMHLAADAGVSLGVAVVGLGIRITSWAWLDPLASIVIGGTIAVGAWGLLRESLDLSLDAVPSHIDSREVARFLRSQPGVLDVHDLHIWAMSTREAALTAHLVMDCLPSSDAFLRGLERGLEGHFGILHATIQCEGGDPAIPCGRTGVGAW